MLWYKTWKRARQRKRKLESIRAARRLRDHENWVASMTLQFEEFTRIAMQIDSPSVRASKLLQLANLKAKLTYIAVYGRPSNGCSGP